ncbi:MAG: hypothetical protein Unbinned5350contig1004_12 [Prokaryotic dsDNA virus sp.]|nr:MAG: hypothetical protein Unbinned5350contig1004_12 [Prokaryotic dsDNA virus sp.]
MKNEPIPLALRQDFYRKIDLFLGDNPQKKYELTITEQGSTRRLAANAQLHLWFGQIAKHNDDQTPLDVKNFCKDAFGLPLILNSAKHSDKMEFLLDKLSYFEHSHESKMKLIQCLEVTSLLTIPESKIMMEQMIYYFNDNGIPIKFKDK